MTKLPKPLMIILGVLVIILLFDVMVLIKNGFSITALGGMIVVLGTGLYLLRDFGKDVQRQRDAEEAQRRLEAAEEEAEEEAVETVEAVEETEAEAENE